MIAVRLIQNPERVATGKLPLKCPNANRYPVAIAPGTDPFRE